MVRFQLNRQRPGARQSPGTGRSIPAPHNLITHRSFQGRHPPPEQEKNPACMLCGGPHPFDTSIPSVLWNLVIRENGLPDYLCLTCIIHQFATRNESFTAELWGAEFNGTVIDLSVGGKAARGAVLMSAENTSLRQQVETLTASLKEARKALQVYGDHVEGCPMSIAPMFRTADEVACTCGFDAALTPAAERRQ